MRIKHPPKITFIVLLFLISFASGNAVLFTPALPNIAAFFSVSNHVVQQTMIYFLVGYSLGQLIYAPFANRYGRKIALYLGIGLAILSNLLCILAGQIHMFQWLLVGRFFLALGSGVGLKMTFTLVNEYYSPNIAARKIPHLLTSSAMVPALVVAIAGFLNEHFGWCSCFYAGLFYSLIAFILVTRLQETQLESNPDALQIKQLYRHYLAQFSNGRIFWAGALIGSCTAFIYIFAALAPFVAINLLGMKSATYGLNNLLPAMGLILGSLLGPKLNQKYSAVTLIQAGVISAATGVAIMAIAISLKLTPTISIFLPMILIYLATSLIFSNSSTLALNAVTDKAHASAVMNFINMSATTIAVFFTSLFTITLGLLPLVFIVLILLMLISYKFFNVSGAIRCIKAVKG